MRDSGRISWLRALLAGFLAELVLMAVAVVFYLLPNQAWALPIAIQPASFLAFVAFGYWAARGGSGRFALHGLLTAVLGIALYFALTFAALSLPGAPAMDLSAIFAPANLLAHALKVVGGSIGGMLAGRATRVAQT